MRCGHISSRGQGHFVEHRDPSKLLLFMIFGMYATYEYAVIVRLYYLSLLPVVIEHVPQ